MYRVNEIFYSLQGEGYYSGTPAVFVRFSGCNMKCEFCDTDHSSYELMTENQIVSNIASFPARHVVLTGGEPTLQITGSLCAALHTEGYYVAVETNGLRDAIAPECELEPTVMLRDAVDWITCSPKDGFPLPSDEWNMRQECRTAMPLREADELKIVFAENTDDFFRRIEALHRTFSARHYFLQPCSCRNTREVVDYILRHPHWRLSLQIHKMIEIK